MDTKSDVHEVLTAAALKERLARAQRELEMLRHKTSRATSTTLVLTVVALAAICGYFYYGYSQISKYTEPDKLVSYAQQLVEDQLPTVRQSLKEQVIRSAPSWAEGLSKQAIQSLPGGRTKLEGYILEQYENSAQQGITLTDKEFREFLNKNRPLLEQKFKELGSKPELADDSLAELQARLEGTLQANMHAQAGQLLDTILLLNDKLKRLRSDQNLSPQELTERRLLMVVKRMRMEEKDPTLAGKNLPETPRDEIRPVAFKMPRTARGKPVVANARPASKPAELIKQDAKAPAARPPSAGQASTGKASRPQDDKQKKSVEDATEKKEKAEDPGKDKGKR
jgi:hypothetical protein